MIDRYIYAVTKELPEKQRNDIEKELRTLIDDMIEAYEGNESDEVKTRKVLLDLGDPKVLADNYKGSKKYLIGPDKYDTYIFVLKIVMASVFMGITIANIVGGIFSADMNPIGIFVEYTATLFAALMQGFAWVTIIFAVAEHKGVSLTEEKIKGYNWELSQLPKVPKKESRISRVESIFSIIFLTIFISVIWSAPQVIGLYISDGGTNVLNIPIFNIEVLTSYRLLFAGIFILGLLREALKLITGRWTLKLSTALVASGLVSTILTLIIFSDHSIWNSNFATEITNYFNLQINFMGIWDVITRAVFVMVIFGFIIDGATTLYKGIKYNKA